MMSDTTMYTPFLAHLMQHVGVFEKYVRNSEAADQGTGGSMRCPDLSEKQKKGASEIYQAVKKIHLNPTSSKDEQTYKTINDLINKHRKLAEQALENFNLNLGYFEKKLLWKTDTTFLKLLSIFAEHVEQSYQYFKRYRLLDVLHESTPLTMLKTHQINYLVYRAAHLIKLKVKYYPLTGGVREYFYDHELAAKKQEVVLSYLNNPNLIDTRDKVREYAHAIRNADNKVLETQATKGTVEPNYYGLSAKIPVKAGYTPYKLHEEMTIVLDALDTPKFETPTATIQLSNFLREDHTNTPPSSSILTMPASRSHSNNNNNNNDDTDDDDYQDCNNRSGTTSPVLHSSGHRLTAADLQKLDEANQSSSPEMQNRKGTFSVTYSDDEGSQKGLKQS